MKRLLGLIVLCLVTQVLPAQSWQELYDRTNDCWGTDWQACSEILEQAVRVAREEFGELNENYVLTVNDLGACYCMMGQYSRALPLLQDALEMTEQIVGKEDESYGTRLSNLGSLYQSIGQYEIALPLFQEALINAEKNDGKDHPDYGIRLNNLGTLYMQLGEYKKALTYLEQSLHNTELNSGKEGYDYGNRLSNIGVLHFHLGEYEEALPLLKESLENAEINLGKEHEEYGIRLNNLGNLYRDMGRYEAALPLLQESIENTEKNLGKEHSKYGQSLNNLGDLYRDMGQYKLALPFLQEALTCTKNSLGKQHEQYGNRLHNLAELYEDMAQYDEALPYVLELLAVLSAQLTSQFAALNDRIQRSFLRTKTHQFDHISSFRFAHPEYEQLQATGFDQQLLLKGFLQNQRIDLLQSLRTHSDTHIQQLYTEWELLHRQLAQQYQKPINERLSSFETLQNRADDLEIKLANQSLTFRKVRKQVKWQEVQAELSEEEAAIEFAHFPLYHKGKQTDSVMYIAFVLRTGDAHPHMISLFEEKELERQLVSKKQRKIFNRLYTFRGIKPRRASLSYIGLADLMWKPIDSLLVGKKRIYYSPSGLMNRLNLGAIPIDKQQFLSDKYELVQLGSSRGLAFEEMRDRASTKNRVLLLGGIQYDKPTTSDIDAHMEANKHDEYGLRSLITKSRGGLDSWKYLQGTVTEVQTIQHLLAEKAYETHLLMGSEATEKKLKEQSSSPRILHIATHGYFFPDPGDTTERYKLNTDKFPPIQFSEHPMVRSGLILAGANHAWAGNPVPEGQEDGILTAYEISQLDLSSTELVVLSACETGLGDIQGNEGVYGLQRAFKIAGAKYVIMSLWQVPDKATQELMTAFYENWLGGMEIRVALQVAQKTMRKKYKEPYYWAGFVLVE